MIIRTQNIKHALPEISVDCAHKAENRKIELIAWPLALLFLAVVVAVFMFALAQDNIALVFLVGWLVMGLVDKFADVGYRIINRHRRLSQQ